MSIRRIRRYSKVMTKVQENEKTFKSYEKFQSEQSEESISKNNGKCQLMGPKESEAEESEELQESKG
jgi:hypothetical protein